MFSISIFIFLFVAPEPKIVTEWLKSRTISTTDLDKDKRLLQGKSPGKIQRKDSLRKMANASSTTKAKKLSQMKLTSNDIEYDSDDSFSEDKRLYSTITNEYVIRINEIMSVPNAFGVHYLFELHDLTSDVLVLQDSLTKSSEKVSKGISKISKLKMSTKSGIGAASMNFDVISTSSIDKLKDEMLAY